MKTPSQWFFVIGFLALALCASACGCGDDDDDDDSAAPGDDDVADDDDTDDDIDDDDTGDDDTQPDDDTGDDDTIDPAVQELLDSGRNWLKIGEGDKARMDFGAALDIDSDVVEAQYGMVLGNLLRHFDIISILYDYIDSLGYGGPVAKADGPDNWLDNILNDLLTGLLYDRSDELVEYAEIAQQDDDPTYMIDAMPVILHFERVADLRTEFDRAELYGASGFARVMSGLFRHLTAVSLDVDISYAFVILDVVDRPWPQEDILGAIVNVLIDMIGDPNYPDFLTMPPENVDELRMAGMSVGDGCDDFLSAWAAIEAETDDQSDDVIAFNDVNGDGMWNFGEPLIVPGVGELTAEQMDLVHGVRTMIEDLRNSFWDYTIKDVDPSASNPFPLADLNPILQALGIPPIIPDLGITRVDFGKTYVDPGYDEFKQTLLAILEIADSFLPDPPL
ncbi:MAG: hypothetical protein KJ042_02810 [Deltaproteobacteria bacterium]|nr:hypothetical protein [Deltaproteobacteria bacterium]